MNAYYNEHDPFAAAWLRGLIAAGLWRLSLQQHKQWGVR